MEYDDIVEYFIEEVNSSLEEHEIDGEDITKEDILDDIISTLRTEIEKNMNE